MDETRRVLVELIHGIASGDPQKREQAADEVTDVSGSFSPTQAATLVGVLVEVHLMEQEPSCQESQLNALCDLRSQHPLSDGLFEPLRSLRKDDIQGSQREYLDELLQRE